LPNTYKIGTRGSLLAKTQCNQIKQLLAKKTQQVYQLEFIQTQGDVQTEQPLWQLEGKDFFTKELDAALLKEEVDLVVHSYKDLGSERPAGIKLGAITERKFSNDILLIKKSTVEKISGLAELVIGTSSPRRIYNIENFLAEYIPHQQAPKDGTETSIKISTKISTKMLRGNINTRIQKLKDDHYHGIVLALAGLERLAQTPASAAQLKNLLKDLTFMVLPQSVFPSAAAQGALGIEYYAEAKNAREIQQFIATQNHPDTIDEVQRERQAFQEYGGGCHLAVGINVRKIKNHYLHTHRGENDGARIDYQFLERNQPPPKINGKIFIGLPEEKVLKYSAQNILADKLMSKSRLPQVTKAENIYTTSNYCLHALTEYSSLWASGVQTMKKLVSKGHWVNGCSDGLGEEVLIELKSSQALALMLDTQTWCTLSHSDGKSQIGPVLPVYERSIALQIPDHYPTEIAACAAFYWTSFLQYQVHLKLYPNIQQKIHCCGLGKTYDTFLENNISVTPFASVQDILNERTL